MPDLSGPIGYVLVAALGAAVGMGELIARYRDEPVKALRSSAAAVYVAVNVMASLSALAAIQIFGWFSATPPTAQSQLTQVLIAGFGAMAVFRSSLFVVRVGTDDVGIGPVAFLQIILGASDRAVDRKRGVDRAPRVSEIMKGLEFNDIAEAFPPYAMALLQNVDPADAEELGDRVKGIRDSKMNDRLKVLNLGLVTMNVVGEDVLEAAAKAFRKDATTASTATTESPADPPTDPPADAPGGPPAGSGVGGTAAGTGVGGAPAEPPGQ